ncbi:MAG: hypothetical protein JWP75_1989 [Frondihabitans sp.]|nr:hypothetical protein [Frondihabitans sp.]
MKKPSLKTAVALPAVLLIGLAGSAFVAAPAFAETVAPTSTSTQSPEATTTAAPTTAPAPKVVTAPAVAPTPAPSDLIVTSPTDGEEIHGTRTVDFVGRAPLGSSIKVLDIYGHNVGHTTAPTTVADFTIPVTIAADAPYDQYMSVVGTVGKRALTEQDIEVIFDAVQSDPPVVTVPVTGNSITGTAVPLFSGYTPGDDVAEITISGTGTPGDDIALDLETTADASGFAGQLGDVVVGSDSTWSVEAFAPYGRITITAQQGLVDENFNSITVPSDNSNTSVVIVEKAAGFVSVPTITKPVYPDDSFFASAGASQAAIASSPSDHLRPKISPLAKDFAATRTLGKSPRDSSAASGGENDLSGIGIDVKGISSSDHPGLLGIDIAGYGVAGDHIVIYHNDPTDAFTYLEGLYPNFFAQLGLPAGSVPATTVPADDGSIVVDASGRWSTTLWLKKQDIYFAAFQVDPKTGNYSVAGGLTPIHLTGDPATGTTTTTTAVGAPTELAFTGSNATLPLALGLGILGGGVALLVVASRRRLG